MTRPFRLPMVSVLLTLLATLGLPGSVAHAQPDLGNPFGEDPFAESGPEVRVEIKAASERVAPGDQLGVVVVLDHQAGWHSQARAEEISVQGLVATSVEAEVQNGVIGPVQWPESHEIQFDLGNGPEPIRVYEGRSRIYVPLQIPESAPVGSEVVVSIRVQFQACDDLVCIAPDSREEVIRLPIVAIEDRGDLASDEDFAGFDFRIFAQRELFGAATDSAGEVEAARPEFFGIALPRPDGAVGLGLFALLAALGGLVLNLTPCVLPVIPIKIMTISHHAGSPGKSFYLGLWMAVGVIAFWALLGVLALVFAGTLSDPSRLFGYWQFTLPIGLLIAAMGVGSLGAFAVKLPQAVYKVNPKADSAFGSMLFGVMTAILGLPCFGFVAGALLAGSATMPSIVILTIFIALGVGMALPYLVLSARPGWVEKMPRTGPASELVKQVLGLLMLAAASFFIGAGVLALLGGMDRFAGGLPWWGKSVHWWAVGVFAAAAGLWLIVRTVQITKRPGRRLVFAVVGLVVGAGGVLAAIDRTTHAYHNIRTPYTPEALAEALDRGDVVVLDFTAVWCLNCKSLEAAFLSRAPVKPLLLEPGVVPMVADVTSSGAPGWEKLAELGQTGIPLLVVYGPGLESPWLANTYTGPVVVDAIERARGGRAVGLGGDSRGSPAEIGP
ncbi:MAG: protein-disulfide reductase DsbD family protein [Phycisphaerales bacterium JB059]